VIHFPAQRFATPVGRRWLFGLLYLSEGAPMGFIWWALPVLLTADGVSLATVTTLSATLTLPWVFKFLAGPLIDLGVRRGQKLQTWIVVCQICMGLTLLPLMFIDWSANFDVLVAVLFVHACFAATQDVGIDTLAIRIIPVEELGRINGWMQTGMLSGRALVAAAAVGLVNSGLQVLVIGALVALIWLPLLCLLIARPDEGAVATEQRRISLRSLLAWPVIPGLCIALTVGAGFEFFTVTAGPLLMQLGGSAEQTAILFGVFAPLGLALGALAGGYFSAAQDARVGTITGLCLVALAVAGFVTLRSNNIIVDPAVWLLPLGILYFAAGFLICASYTLFMRLSRGAYAATRYSLFMSATNGCETWAAFAGGRLAGPLGYNGAMLVLVAASVLALPILLLASLIKSNSPEAPERT
jgi:hypothetical protein